MLECRVIKPSKESLGKVAWLVKNCAAVGSLKTGQLENNEFWGEKLLQVEIKDGVKSFL